MYVVPWRKAQSTSGLRSLQQLPVGHIFSGNRSDISRCLHAVPQELELACGQHRRRRLHVQRWLHRPQWRGLPGVRGGQAQGSSWQR